MNLHFLVITGHSAGLVIPITDGMSIGRSGATLTLPLDPKVSVKHAYVQTEDHKLVLVDDQSRNGVWIQDQRVNRVELQAGLLLTIGETRLQVIPHQPAPQKTSGGDRGAQMENRLLKNEPTPSKAVIDLLTSLPGHKLSGAVTPCSFEKAIQLKFIRGPELETQWTIAYGPRRFGWGSSEFPIRSAEPLRASFVIFSEQRELRFCTDTPEHVQIGHEMTSSRILRDGDTIQIKDTEIQIDFSFD